jgi:CheY-like chemotaxis protein
MDIEALHLSIRRKLAAGSLPTDTITRIVGFLGDEEVCDACELVISNEQFFMKGISRADNQALQLHLECLYIWDLERHALGHDPPPPSRRELDGIHALVVDDTDDSREILRVALEQCGAFVWAAATVEDARRILETLRPHILVTDIAMPNDGVQLIREVMAVAANKGVHIPAIAVTAYRGRRAALLAEGFVDLVEKPLDPFKLCGAVRRHAQIRT